MPLSVPSYRPMMPTTIMPFGPASEPFQSAASNSANASLAAGTLSNTTVYAFPFLVWEPYTVKAVAVVNGATVNGNWDIGVYSYDGATQYVSTGATAQSGTSAAQVVTVASTLLAPGRYWMAFGVSSATATYARWTPSSNWTQASGQMIQTVVSGAPLPATLTLATSTAVNVPLFALMDRTDY